MSKHTQNLKLIYSLLLRCCYVFFQRTFERPQLKEPHYSNLQTKINKTFFWEGTYKFQLYKMVCLLPRLSVGPSLTRPHPPQVDRLQLETPLWVG